ncbi:MAG TPA: hypothetical protein VMT87_11335 [Vicinamibacteria bacterium]|nr:hypothetical protein [Vicinamibacteria bacterium]
MSLARLTCAALVLSAAVGLAQGEQAEPAASGARWTPEYAVKVKRVSNVRVSPDGSRVAWVVATAAMDGEKSEWISQIHVARSDGSGAFQLTQGEKSDRTTSAASSGTRAASTAGAATRRCST